MALRFVINLTKLTTTPLFLHWRTGNITIRTKYTAVFVLGLYYLTTTWAFPKVLTRVFRHLLLFLSAAIRAG